MKEGKIRKFDDTQRTDNQTVQRLRPLYPLWILEGVGQLPRKWRRKSQRTNRWETRKEKIKDKKGKNKQTQKIKVGDTICGLKIQDDAIHFCMNTHYPKFEF